MYVNKCTKCGADFETKNPKRVICPGCLYPDRQGISLNTYSNVLNKPENSQDQNREQGPRERTNNEGGFRQKSPGYYVGGQDRAPRGNSQYNRPRNDQGGGYNRDDQRGGGYNRDNQRGGGYNRDDQRGGGYNRGYRDDYNRGGGNFNRSGPPRQHDGQRPQGGGFRRPQQGPPGQRYNNNQRFGGGQRPQSGGFRRPGPGGPPRGAGGFNNRRRPDPNKKLLISREQVAQIEEMYTAMLPLPNPDCHEVIGEKIELEPNKVFFGINLVRQKFKLPKLPYPKRKLAVSPEQLIAIKNLYEPLLPLPPIGCHKFISKQLKMDEWRVHVGIGIIRKQMNLPRWTPDREDAPAEFKNQAKEEG